MRTLQLPKRWIVSMLVAVGLSGCGWVEADARAESTFDATLREYREDADMLQRYDRGLEETLVYAANHSESSPLADDAPELDRDDRDRLRQTHAALLDRMRALDQIKSFWGRALEINRLREPQLHARAYLNGYAAWLVQYRRGLQWVELTLGDERLATVLDEPTPAYDLPADSYSELKNRVLHLGEMSRLWTGYGYYKSVRDDLIESGCRAEETCRETMELVESHHRAARRQLKRRGVHDLSYNAWDNTRSVGLQAWYPLQERVARWMGDTRVHRKGDHLISREQLAEARQKLEPGDIIVTRKNWYLSNLGLPGFWPHAELYLGAPEELEAHFDDPEVRAHFREETGYDGLVEYLKEEHPRAWRAYRADGESEGHHVIEGRAEGIIFNSLYEAAGADYAAAMRPRSSRVDRAEAVVEAFGHWGKEYDFNFDFLTDRRLVCTELVYNAWHPTAVGEGVDFELHEVMGRTTLPANEIVRQFDEEYDGPGRQLDFVFFFDGREKDGEAVSAGLEAFRESWKRPKWDVMQP